MNKPGFFLLLTALLLASVVPGQAQQSQFGGAVAIGDDEVFVSEATNTVSPGTVFVYRRDGGLWSEHAQLSASDADLDWDDRFGRALATDGRTLVVGATKRGGTRGGVYFFEKNNAGVWTETARFAAVDAADDDHHGRVLAISGDFVFVSSLGHNESAGAVYVYRRTAETGWAYHSKLTGTGVEANGYFGMTLALDGDKALIGAPPHKEGMGAVFAFHYDAANDTWNEAGMLQADSLKDGHQFGAAVALKGERAFVGAPRHDGDRGAVYAYRYDAASQTWVQQDRLVPSGEEKIRLGMSLALNGDELWAGSPAASGFQGAVHLYRKEADAWAETKTLTAYELQRGDFFAGTLAVAGRLAVVGATGADYGAGTAIIFERDAASGQWVEKITVLNEKPSFASVTGGQVDCTDGAANQFECSEVDLVSFLSVKDIGGSRGVRTNDVWGWTDPQTGNEYALVGRVDGASFIDMSNAYHPVFLGNLPRTEGANPSTWRDIKVYKDHAFIVSDGAGEHGVQIFDLTQLRDVENAPVTFEETAHYDGIHSAHNIVINEASGFAYTVGSSGGGETCGGGLHMIDIREPTNPVFAGCFSDPSTGRASTGYSHDAQCVTYNGPDAEHQGKEICFGANETALSIADVTDKDSTIALSRATYPNVGYSHQGWLTEDHRYFYMNDELDELQGKVEGTRTLIWDVTDLDDPQMLKEFYSEGTSSDHNLYIRGTLMYQSNYVSGLRIFDISDVANPVEVAHFDTVPYGENGAGFNGSWSNYPYFDSGVIVVTSMSEGVFFLKKRTVDI